MIFPQGVPVYGDIAFRGKCPPESIELASFFSRLRREYRESYGLVAFHPRNEGPKQKGQFSSVLQHQAEGMTPGAPDIIIPALRPFVCELKRCDHTLSKWQDGQIAYLETAGKLGCFACVALGAVAAWQAFQDWTTSTATMSETASFGKTLPDR